MFGDPKEIAGKIPILGFIIKFLSGEEFDIGGLVAVLAGALFFIGVSYTDISQSQVFTIVIALTPIWLTYYLFMTWFDNWMGYIGKMFALSQGRTTLRIKLPQEVKKSPEAMEFVLGQIFNPGGVDNLFQTYWDGVKALPISLELVSIGGDVRFYVNVPTKKTKSAFEANMYAQYPGIEIEEEPVDYAAEIPMGTDDWEWMPFHIGKRKDQEFPIKTYIDFGLDKLPKEEEKIDPMTPMLEALGALGPNERGYVQIICTAFRKKSFKNGSLMFGESPAWEKKVTEKINEIMNRDPKTKAAKESGTGEELARLTSGERDAVTAMERNAGKYAFNTQIRWLYAAKKGHFNGENIGKVNRSFSQYDIISDYRNTIGVRWRAGLNYADYIPGSDKKIAGWKKSELKELKLRKVVGKNQADGGKIFTTEELATIWHIPGQVAITPNLSRIPSTRSEAPTNLPIGELPT